MLLIANTIVESSSKRMSSAVSARIGSGKCGPNPHGAETNVGAKMAASTETTRASRNTVLMTWLASRLAPWLSPFVRNSV